MEGTIKVIRYGKCFKTNFDVIPFPSNFCMAWFSSEQAGKDWAHTTQWSSFISFSWESSPLDLILCINICSVVRSIERFYQSLPLWQTTFRPSINGEYISGWPFAADKGLSALYSNETGSRSPCMRPRSDPPNFGPKERGEKQTNNID